MAMQWIVRHGAMRFLGEFDPDGGTYARTAEGLGRTARRPAAGRRWRSGETPWLERPPGRPAARLHAERPTPENGPRPVEDFRSLAPAEVLPALRAGRVRGVPAGAAAGRRAGVDAKGP